MQIVSCPRRTTQRPQNFGNRCHPVARPTCKSVASTCCHDCHSTSSTQSCSIAAWRDKSEHEVHLDRKMRLNLLSQLVRGCTSPVDDMKSLKYSINVSREWRLIKFVTQAMRRCNHLIGKKDKAHLPSLFSARSLPLWVRSGSISTRV